MWTHCHTEWSALVVMAAGDTSAIGLRLVLTAGDTEEPGALGVVTGSWHPDGPEALAVTGYMAVLREASPVR